MAGMLNQAAPFIATGATTIILSKMFFGSGKFQKNVISELEAANTEIANNAASMKELRGSMKTIATEMKKVQDLNKNKNSVVETATKNLQKQLDSNKKDNKNAMDSLNKEVAALRATQEKNAKELMSSASTIKKLEAELKNVKETQNAIAASPAPVPEPAAPPVKTTKSKK